MQRIVMFAAALFFAAAAQAQTWRVFAVGGKSLQNRHGQADVSALGFELERRISDRTQIGFAIAPYHVDQPVSWFGDQFGEGNESVNAISAALLLRRQFRVGSSVVPYVEVGTGPMWAERRVPAATSRFNFVSTGGAGATFLANRPIAFFAGYRLMHVSNGGYAPRNPGLNVNALVIGLRVRR